MQEGEQESLDLILSQSADGRHGAAAHGGAASLQLEQKYNTHKKKKHTVSGEILKFRGGKQLISQTKIGLLYLVTISIQQFYF